MLGKDAQPDWDHLRVFLAVARERRLARAARRLRVEHTTVGRRIAALERQIGAPVFHRTVSGYMLTAVGQSLVPIAEAMERAAITIAAHVGESSGRLAGRVRLGLPPEFATDWLVPHLGAFRARHPQIALQVLVGSRTLDLSRGEVDLALRTPRPPQPGLVTARIARAALRLYASARMLGGRALSVTDAASLRGAPLLVFAPQLQLLQQAAWFQPVMSAAEVVLETNGTHVLLAAARAGIGVAVLPKFVARNYADLVPVSPPVAEHDVWLVTHPEFRRDPKVRATADFLKHAARGPRGLI